MGFLSPWFLGGLLAVGLPVYLHLLKRHKTDPQPFPSLQFFEHREQSSVQHRRLDYILLFILRALMLVILALLFANPYINTLTAKGRGDKIVVVAVDRSFSMRTREGTATRLDRAKQEALDIIGKIPPGTTAQVVALAGTTQAMTQQIADPGELRSAVAAITQSDSRANFGELSRYLRTLTENTKKPIEAHLVSDLQKSGLPPGFLDLRLDSDTKLTLYPVGSEVPNWAVETVIAPPRVYDPKRVRIQATVAGFDTPATTKTVSLLLNGKVVGTKQVMIPENGRGTAEFLGLDASYGFNRAEVRLDSSDALTADDSYPFAVERTDPKKVLFVDEGRGNAAFYFRTAIDASPDAAFTLDVQRPEGASGANLSNYAVVVLSNLSSLPNGLEESLKRYVTGGGSVFVALGSGSAALPRVPVADEPIDTTRYAASERERFLNVTDIDTGHVVTKDVRRFDGVKFYQAIKVKPANSTVIARLNDATPLLFERQIGEGKVLVFASTFDNIANDLPIHAAWVPFVQRSVEYLGAGGVEQPVNLAVDQYVELRSGEAKGASAEVLDPEGKRVLSLEEAATARNFGLNREGFFEIRTAGGRRTLVAAHADRKESDLAVIPKEMQDLWTARDSNTDSSGNPAAGSTGEGLTKQESLAPYLLLLLLGLAIAESVISDRYLRPSAELTAGAK